MAQLDFESIWSCDRIMGTLTVDILKLLDWFNT